MKRVIEKKIGNASVFFIEDGDQKTVVDVTYDFIDVNGVNRIVMWDSNMFPLNEVSNYIENLKMHVSENTQKSILQSLKVLHEYLDIKDLKYKDIKSEDIRNLGLFVRGESFTEGQEQYYLETTRSEKTSLGIICDITGFLNYLNLPNLKKLGFNIYTIGKKGRINDFILTSRRKSKVSRRAKTLNVVPIYITKPQMESIISAIRGSNKDYIQSKRDEIIVRIMYEGGARIGEVLGITLEDIEFAESVKSDTGEAYEYGVIKIRNRITDNLTQRAKTVPTARTAYNPKNPDLYEEVFVSKELIEQIEEYVELSTGEANVFSKAKKGKIVEKRKRRKSKYDDARADAVAGYRKNGKDNYYVFLSKYFKPISQSGWNKTLKEYFIKAGVPLDSNHKSQGLNHRFRHGFAMRLVHAGCKMEDLQRLMRHSSPESTLVYYNPTRDELIKKKEEFDEHLGLFKSELESVKNESKH